MHRGIIGRHVRGLNVRLVRLLDYVLVDRTIVARRGIVRRSRVRGLNVRLVRVIYGELTGQALVVHGGITGRLATSRLTYVMGLATGVVKQPSDDIDKRNTTLEVNRGMTTRARRHTKLRKHYIYTPAWLDVRGTPTVCACGNCRERPGQETSTTEC